MTSNAFFGARICSNQARARTIGVLMSRSPWNTNTGTLKERPESRASQAQVSVNVACCVAMNTFRKS